ncbi:hypothetical protein BV898_18350 [Hypsibius exemplaris]|uniref:Uncharacterized protein n=1 Tax=Hypsibius exemplaris TaxID=2072580 RepID=A0A9X6NJL2_HYPEX|nr:hypothetical protein BV898_18350 [Hypsibius exemplaris]
MYISSYHRRFHRFRGSQLSKLAGRLVYSAISEFLHAIPTIQQSTVPGDGGGSSVCRTVDLVIGDNCIAVAIKVCHDRGVTYFSNTAAASMTLGPLFAGADYPTLRENENDSGIMFNSVRELEEDMVRIIETFSVINGIALLFVGPLMPQTEKVSVSQLEQQEMMKKWLDRQEKLSVANVNSGRLPCRMESKLRRWLYWQRGNPSCGLFARQSSAIFRLNLVLKFRNNSKMRSLTSCSSFGLRKSQMFADQKSNGKWLMQRSTAIMVEGTGLQSKRVVLADKIANLLKQVEDAESAQTPFCQAALDWRAKLDAATAMSGSPSFSHQTRPQN